MSSQAFAIYEHGTLKLLDPVPLSEQQRVRVRITAVDEEDAEPIYDPLDGIEVGRGIYDLAEHFDDYRFGLRQP